MAENLEVLAEPLFRTWTRFVVAHPWLVELPAFAAALVDADPPEREPS